MSADVKHLNPSDLTQQELDRIAFALMGHMKLHFMVEKPLTREKAAEYMSNISLATFDRMRKAGKIKEHVILGTPYFLPSELLQSIKDA